MLILWHLHQRLFKSSQPRATKASEPASPTPCIPRGCQRQWLLQSLHHGYDHKQREAIPNPLPPSSFDTEAAT